MPIKILDDFGFKNPCIIRRKGENMKEKNKEWKKVEDEIFRFENEGDMIDGTLKSVEDSATYQNKVYKILKGEKTYVVFGTTVLDSQMKSVDVGKEVKIMFTGEKESEKKGHNPIKLFEVFVR